MYIKKGLKSVSPASYFGAMASFMRTSPFTYDSASRTWKPSITPPSIVAGEVFRVITWNIDFMEPFQPERVVAALTYLETLLQYKPEPTIILLQEIMGSSLSTLLASPWVKSNFQISHTQLGRYQTYFTITLVSRGVGAVSVFRTPLVKTCMGRDGLFVDIPVSYSPTGDRNVKSVLRICNTHLESLQLGNSIRPLQLSQIASLLRTPPSADTEIVAGLVGGDMNAISPNDEDLHWRPDICLQDVYQTTKEDEASHGDVNDGLGEREGYTWGYQPTCQYPPGRLDKIMFTGILRPWAVGGSSCVTRLGVGLKTKVQDTEPGAEVWVTDHFGIAATFMVLAQDS